MKKICIILMMIAFSGCQPSPRSPDPWEKKVGYDLTIPQDSCRVWTTNRGVVRVIYVFQTDQQWIDHIHSYVKSQNELNKKNPYYPLFEFSFLACTGMEKDFAREIEKNPRLEPLVKDFMKDDFCAYNKSLYIIPTSGKKIRLGIIYKKLAENQYLVIIGMSPPEIIPN